MSKMFKARGMVVDKIGIKLISVTIVVDTENKTIEYRAANHIATTSFDKVEELMSEYNIIGTTAMKDDKKNRTRIRYTYGIHGKPSTQVTMSLSQLDKSGNDEYMITADAEELDKYLRRLFKNENN